MLSWPLLRPALPALLLALFLCWSGGFHGGAGGVAALAGHVALVGVAGWGWRGWDPLRLGRGGRALSPLLWLLMLASCRLSPVTRAGWVAVALLPLLLAVPAAVARAWAGGEQRRRGMAAVAVVAGATAGWALVAWVMAGAAGAAAQPLGHHLLLGAVLATLLPISLASALAAGPTPASGRPGAWAARGGAALVAAALLATGSASAVVAAALGCALVLAGRRRAVAWLLVPAAAAVAAVVLLPRLLGPAVDPSLAARLVYWRGALAGLAERPLLGWGPGSTAWTLPLHLRPIPGVTPPGEVVGDAHSLPLQLAYELGIAGSAAAALVAALFFARRWREGAWGDGLGRAGLAGLASGLVALLAGPTLGTLAPWVALAVAAGAALASTAPAAPGNDRNPGSTSATGSPHSSAAAAAAPTRRREAPAGWLYAALAILLLLPLDLAHVLYDAARRAPPQRARELLLRASAFDPEHPLYHLRLGWLPSVPPAARLGALRTAALAAPGVGAIQLAAGAAAFEAGKGGRAELLRACATDPLDGMAPLLLAFGSPQAPEAPALAARAQLATPALAAAVEFERRARLWGESRRLVWEWPGVDPGYARALLEATRDLPREGPVAPLQRRMDERPATALSLVAFRRLPWPAALAAVPVRLAAARAVRAPSAAALPITGEEAFPKSCAPPR